MLRFTLLVTVGFLWGSQYLCIKIALADLDPLTISVLRCGLGALVMAAACILWNRSPPPTTRARSPWWIIAVIGLLETGLPTILIAWSQRSLDSGLVAIMLGTTPLFTIALVTICLRVERITLHLVAAVVVGFAGLVILLGFRIHLEGPVKLLPVLSVLIAAFCFATSIILLTTIRGRSAITLSRDLLGWSFLPLALVWLIRGDSATIHLEVSSVAAILFLATFGGGIVFLLYILLIRTSGPTFASLSNYLVPLVGVLLGITAGREKLLPTDLIATAVILAALAGAGPVRSWSRRQGNRHLDSH